MGINVLKGNVTIHNYVEKGAKVENHYNGTVYQGTHNMEEEGKESQSKPLSLYEVIEAVLPGILSARMWFAVYKAFEQKGKVAKKDFAGFKTLIETTYTEPMTYRIDQRELSDLNSLSFSKEIDKWDINFAPVKRAKEFNAYKDLAMLTLDLLDAVV